MHGKQHGMLQKQMFAFEGIVDSNIPFRSFALPMKMKIKLDVYSSFVSAEHEESIKRLCKA